MFHNHRRLTVLAAGIVLAAALLGSWALFEGASQSDASRKQPFGDAIATLQQDPGAAVARVNGVDIPAAKLRAYGILSEAGFGVDAAPKIPASQYLDGLINSEVLYQEAVKDGFAPTAEAIHSLAVEQKTGLLDFIQQDTPEAANLRSVFDEVKGTPYGLDVYDTSPEMLDGFRRQLSVNALETHVISQLPAADQKDPAKRNAAIDSLTVDLRSHAKIEILAPVSY